MDAKQISGLGRKLKRFLSEFDDCFVRSEPRDHLGVYVRGQLSNLPRKSIEPMALASRVPPRTLQCFLDLAHWDESRMRDRVQWIVARDHLHPAAIGMIDDSGNPKKGRHTAGVQRQWCGNTGKKDNCVVAVHLGYVAGDFHCLLDSDVYLPEGWASDAARRKAADIPEDVVYRKKTAIALDQVRRALANGIRVWAWTFDEWYGRDGEFLDALDALGQNYVGEVPATFTGWIREPDILLRPTPQDRHRRGRTRRFPRLSAQALPASEVRNLVRYSRIFQHQSWQRFKIKEGEKGPVVWEVKHACFYRKHLTGLPGRIHWLIVARNVLDPEEVKYFVANLPPDTPVERVLHVAFGRWPIEQCFEQSKNELGMDHFEVRSWPAIHRHLYITHLSHLFCSRVHQDLREKNDRGGVSDGGAGANGRLHDGRGVGALPLGTTQEIPSNGRATGILPTPEHAGQEIAYEDHVTSFAKFGNSGQPTSVVCTG
jgi:SRSO17 transposase